MPGETQIASCWPAAAGLQVLVKDNRDSNSSRQNSDFFFFLV